VWAWVDGLPEDEPLRVGVVYDLKFEIAAPDSPPRSVTRSDAQWQAHSNSHPYSNVLIILETRSFRVYGEQQQTLVLPHEGRSRNTATFCIEPQELGPGEIIALCLTNGYLCQKMTITLQVSEAEAKTQGRSVRTQVNGMTLGSGIMRSLRQTRKQAPEATTTLAIIKTEDGYQAVLQNAQSGVVRAHLNVSEKQITDMLARTRDDLKFVLSYRMDGRSVYQQEDPRIPLEAHLASRNILAQLGSHLYQQLFYAPERSPDARAMGDLLRLLSRQQPMNIEIVTERFVFPWALLYDRDLSKPEQVNTDGFWGFRHIIQHLPEFYGTALVPIASEITVEDAFTVGFFSEQSLESESGLPLVQQQRDALETLPGIELHPYPARQDLYDLLSNPDAPEHFLYFFCRAESYFPGDQTRSKIVLSDGDIRLDDLVSKVPASLLPLKQSPLVFLNACQSTQLNPYLYNGLVPYLMSRGIRGVVGTESEVPAPFAADFARRFIQRFATGNQTLGETLLRLRQEYLSREHNLLGLFYGLYSNGEIIVHREQPAGEGKEETPRVLSPDVSFGVPAAGVPAAEPEATPAQAPRTLGGQSYNVIGNMVDLVTGKKKEDTEQSLLDETKDTLFGSVQEFTRKLGESLRNVMENVSSLDVSTYVSDNLTDEVVKNLTREGQRVAFTRIKFDGDTEACVPIDEGDIDETLWKMHLEMVERAQVHRAELIKTLTEAASELVNVFK